MNNYKEKIREKARVAADMGNKFKQIGYSSGKVVGSFLKNGTWYNGSLEFGTLINFLWLYNKIDSGESLDGYKNRIFINCTFDPSELEINNEVYFLNCSFTKIKIEITEKSPKVYFHNCTIKNIHIDITHFVPTVTISLSQIKESVLEISQLGLNKAGLIIEKSAIDSCFIKNAYSLLDQTIKNSIIVGSNMARCSLTGSDILGTFVSFSTLNNCTSTESDVVESICNRTVLKESTASSVLFKNGLFKNSTWYGGKWVSGTWERSMIKLIPIMGEHKNIALTARPIKRKEKPEPVKHNGLFMVNTNPNEVLAKLKGAGFIVKDHTSQPMIYGGDIVVIGKKGDESTKKFNQIMNSFER